VSALVFMGRTKAPMPIAKNEKVLNFMIILLVGKQNF